MCCNLIKGKSWKTTAAGWAFVATLAGSIAADPALIPVIAPYKGYLLLASAIAGKIAFAMTKDADVTGGNRTKE
jgi:hypothetical protein